MHQNYGLSIIRFVQSKNHQVLMEYLKKYPEFVDFQDHNKKTGLHYAVAAEDLESMLLLKNAGANLSLKDYQNLTPLYEAIFQGHDESASLLIHWGAKIDATEYNTDGLNALHIYAKNGNIIMLKLLLDTQNISIHTKDTLGYTPLHYAAEYGHQNIIKLLIEYGADGSKINNIGRTPLFLAVQFNHLDSVLSLLEREPFIDIRDHNEASLLHAAAYSGSIAIMNLILEYPNCPSIDVTDNTGTSALHIACSFGNLEIVRTLLLCAANINLTTLENLTPLHLAVSGEYCDTMDLLLTKEADPNVVSHIDGSTALHYAAIIGNIYMIRQLVYHGANINAQNTRGNTPLIFCIAHRHVEAIHCFLSLKADVLIYNQLYQTPLILALLSFSDKDSEIIEELLKAGSDLDSILYRGFSTREWIEYQGTKKLKHILQLWDEQQYAL